MRKTAGNPMGWGQNWKLPARGEMPSLTKNLGSNRQRHLPEKEVAKVPLPNGNHLMVPDVPARKPALGAEGDKGRRGVSGKLTTHPSRSPSS